MAFSILITYFPKKKLGHCVSTTFNQIIVWLQNYAKLPEMPAHDLVFQILRSKITMAAKWAKSPTNRKIFMARDLQQSKSKRKRPPP